VTETRTETWCKKKKKGSRKQPPTGNTKEGRHTERIGLTPPMLKSQHLPKFCILSSRKQLKPFLSQDYPKAVSANTRIIALAFSKPALLPKLYKVFTERGVSNLYLQQFAHAVEDCCSALALQPRCLKAYVTRAFANFYLQRFHAGLRRLRARQVSPS
jgi:hypothetical protein